MGGLWRVRSSGALALLCLLSMAALTCAHDGSAVIAQELASVDPLTQGTPALGGVDLDGDDSQLSDDEPAAAEPKLFNTVGLRRATSFQSHNPSVHHAWEGGLATVLTRPGLLRRQQSMPDPHQLKLDSEFVSEDAMGTSYEKLTRDMHVLREPDVARAVDEAARSVGVKKQELAELVWHASSYGDIRALPDVLDEIVRRGWAVWTDLASGCMSDMLVYLARKIRAYDGKFKTDEDPLLVPTHGLNLPYAKSSNAIAKQLKELTTAGARDPVLLLDEVLLRKMKTNESFRRVIFDLTNPKEGGSASIVALYGYVGGLNMFRQSQFKAVIRSLAERLREAQGATAGSLADHIEAIMKHPVEDAVARLYEEFGETTAPEVTWIHASQRGGGEIEDHIYGDIVAQLMPKLPSEGEWYDMLDGMEGCDADAEIGRTLAQRGRFFSMTTMTILSTRIGEKIAQAGFEYDYIYVPVEDNGAKSYQAAALTFLMAHADVDPNILRTKAQLEALPTGSYKFLLLDDYAGTGMSLLDSAEEIHNAGGMAVAPLVQAAKAKDMFAKNGLTSYPGDEIDAGTEPRAWMGEVGYGSSTQFVTMAYMSPDNNCAFASTRLAPLFVLDSKGIKNRDTIPPICSADQAVEAVFTQTWVMEDDRKEYQDKVNVLWDEGADFDCVGYVLQWYCGPATNLALQGLGPMEDWDYDSPGPSVDPEVIIQSASTVPWRSDVKMTRPSEECVEDAIEKMVTADLLHEDSAARVALPMARNLCGFFRLNPGEKPNITYKMMHDQLKLGALYGIDESMILPVAHEDHPPSDDEYETF